MNSGMPPVLDFTSRSDADTQRLGTALAAALLPGSVVALMGELGAGKTRLVQAVCEALGIDRTSVTSPTFMLLQEYEGRLPVYHFDAYRLKDTDEFLELGAEELFEGDGVCLIEWADRIADSLPEDRLTIHIDIVGETERRFDVAAYGDTSSAVLKTLKQRLVS